MNREHLRTWLTEELDVGRKDISADQHPPHTLARVSCTIAGTEQGSVKGFYQIDNIKKTKNTESLDILLSYFCLLEKNHCIILLHRCITMLKWGPQDPNFGSGAKVSGLHMSIRDLKEPGLERREGRTLGRGLFGANCYLSPAGSVRILHARGV